MKVTRNNSTIELIRIIMLSFLIVTHWGVYWHYNDWIDTSIMHEISEFSVTTFAIITGAFAFKKKSLLWKNISRIFFIIIMSIILSTLVYQMTIQDPREGLIVGAMGGNYSWYLFSILPVYAIFPLLKNWINLKRGLVLMILFFAIYFSLRYTVGEIYFENLAPPSTFLSARTVNLFADALLGYVLFEIITIFRNKHLFLLSTIFAILLITAITLLSFSGLFQHFDYINASKEHGVFVFNMQPVIIIGAMSIVGIAHLFPFHSKFINWFALNAYFIYEFHGLWQLIWISVFPNYVMNNLHFDLYLQWICIFAFGFLMSIVLTKVQKNFWDKVFTNPIQRSLDKVFSN